MPTDPPAGLPAPSHRAEKAQQPVDAERLRSMRFGFRTGGFGRWPIRRVFEELRTIGYAGIELCLEHPDNRLELMTAQRIDETRQQLRLLGLEIASVSYHADAEDMASRLPNTFRVIDIAAGLEADVLIVNTERVPAEAKARAFELVVERFQRLCEKAHACGVTLALEPEPGQVIHDTPDLLELMERVGSERLRVNLDIGHAVCVGENLVETIHTLAGAIVHTHIEDIAGRVHKHLLPGDGDIDFAAAFDAFDGIGYRGYYTIDLFNLGDNPSGHARAALERLRLYGTKP